MVYGLRAIAAGLNGTWHKRGDKSINGVDGRT